MARFNVYNCKTSISYGLHLAENSNAFYQQKVFPACRKFWHLNLLNLKLQNFLLIFFLDCGKFSLKNEVVLSNSLLMEESIVACRTDFYNFVVISRHVYVVISYHRIHLYSYKYHKKVITWKCYTSPISNTWAREGDQI